MKQYFPTSNIYGVDVSSTAVQTLEQQILDGHFAVGDISDASLHIPCEPSTVDFVFLVFTLSAIDPAHHVDVFRNAARCLKLGGCVLFRDYSFYDLVQTRCKTSLGEKRYVKLDAVGVAFFSLDNVANVCQYSGLEVIWQKYCTVKNTNRKKDVSIQRVLLTGVYRRI